MCDTLVAPMIWRHLYSSDLNCIEGKGEGRIGGWWEPVCLKIQQNAASFMEKLIQNQTGLINS